MDGTFTNISGATDAMLTLPVRRRRVDCVAMATYTDGFDSGNTAMMVTDAAVTEVPVNVAPEFADETATRSIEENTAAGTAIGDPVAASADSNGRHLDLHAGRDGRGLVPAINSGSGQLSTSAAHVTTRPRLLTTS